MNLLYCVMIVNSLIMNSTIDVPVSCQCILAVGRHLGMRAPSQCFIGWSIIWIRSFARCRGVSLHSMLQCQCARRTRLGNRQLWWFWCTTVMLACVALLWRRCELIMEISCLFAVIRAVCIRQYVFEDLPYPQCCNNPVFDTIYVVFVRKSIISTVCGGYMEKNENTDVYSRLQCVYLQPQSRIGIYDMVT